MQLICFEWKRPLLRALQTYRIERRTIQLLWHYRFYQWYGWYDFVFSRSTKKTVKGLLIKDFCSICFFCSSFLFIPSVLVSTFLVDFLFKCSTFEVFSFSLSLFFTVSLSSPPHLVFITFLLFNVFWCNPFFPYIFRSSCDDSRHVFERHSKLCKTHTHTQLSQPYRG